MGNALFRRRHHYLQALNRAVPVLSAAVIKRFGHGRFFIAMLFIIVTISCLFPVLLRWVLLDFTFEFTQIKGAAGAATKKDSPRL
ncbi:MULTISPECIES: hypothetical protein [Paenibacillus]|uniref:Uncharacterized protein n=1 Tax=Paenibacillus albilobatus TaxID=2716884 RepID=A0A920CET0_9BACL|nr:MULTISPECIES: hypothetical protein [Paenibacillus]GIO34047.1 hypothetical protein J2TS6_51880 [Paenibacillus albilobatus]